MTDKISVKRSYKDGHIAVRVVLNAGQYGASVKVEGSADISSDQARELAKSLIAEADRADAKVASKAAAAERRKKWRDCEIAAGRMKIISLQRS